MVPMYCFRLAGNPVIYYVLDTAKRVRVRDEGERVQMGIASTEVHALDSSNWLFTLPIANPGP